MPKVRLELQRPGALQEDNVESQRAQVGARMEVTAAASWQSGRSKTSRVGGYKMATRLPVRLKAYMRSRGVTVKQPCAMAVRIKAAVRDSCAEEPKMPPEHLPCLSASVFHEGDSLVAINVCLS